MNPAGPFPSLTQGILMEERFVWQKSHPAIRFHCQNPSQKYIFLPFVMSEWCWKELLLSESPVWSDVPPKIHFHRCIFNNMIISNFLHLKYCSASELTTCHISEACLIKAQWQISVVVHLSCLNINHSMPQLDLIDPFFCRNIDLFSSTDNPVCTFKKVKIKWR